MAYFDYLEEKTKEQREFRFFDVWAKAGLFVFLGSLLITIASIIVFAVAVPIGQNVFLDILVGVGVVVGIVGIAIASKAIKMARNIRKKSELGNFSLIWGIFFVLIDFALFVANTWLYFV